MPENLFDVSRQMSCLAPTLEVCLLAESPPNVPPSTPTIFRPTHDFS